MQCDGHLDRRQLGAVDSLHRGDKRLHKCHEELAKMTILPWRYRQRVQRNGHLDRRQPGAVDILQHRVCGGELMLVLTQKAVKKSNTAYVPSASAAQSPQRPAAWMCKS